MSGAGGGTAPMCVGPVTSPMLADTEGHTHTLTITAAQINTGGTSVGFQTSLNGHRHVVTLTTPQFAMLRAGVALTVESSTNSGHFHTYRIECTGS
jgi:hypothetical protein